jgi:hypothetical protein
VSTSTPTRGPHGLALAVAVAAAGALAGDCSHDAPTAPGGSYALSGHVRLTGFLVDDTGRFAGTRVVEDADSVAVDLYYGHAVVGHALTSHGTYRFGGLSPGAYHARTGIIGDVADETTELTIVHGDLVSRDTLRLTSMGDLYPFPNPAIDVVYLTFDVPDTAQVDLRIRDTQGRITQHLLSKVLLPGRRETLWNGRDDAGNPVTGKMYWLTFESGADTRAQLLFR